MKTVGSLDAWMRSLKPLQEQARERMRAAGFDPDNEDDVTEYVDRVIHEHRDEQRARQQEEKAGNTGK